MRQPKQNGAEGMIGETGQIVITDLGELHVQVRSELWDAVSTIPLRQGDPVKVVAAERATLRVQKLEARTTPTGVRVTHGYEEKRFTGDAQDA